MGEKEFVINITVKEDLDAEAWYTERFSVKDNIFGVEVVSSDKESAIEECKGIVLCALGGSYKNIPNNIRFNVPVA